MQISKYTQLNNPINGENVYTSNTCIIRQKYILKFSVPYETLQYCLLLPFDSSYNATVSWH